MLPELPNLTLEQWKDAASIAGVIIAAAVLGKGVLEYAAQGSQRRAERFFEMRKRLKDNLAFREICALLENDDPKLSGIPFEIKRDFLGFFEEVTLLLNSGLIRPTVAHYMFGYYAIQCWDSKNFWNSVDRSSLYWDAFRDFVERMQGLESSFDYSRRKFRV